jgi:threonine dehydrogenase-like Zn-dependent dehydrogenase
MRAVVATDPGVAEVRDVPDPRPRSRPAEALVRVRSAGICGTDLKVLSGKVPAHRPVVLGHEVMGVVEVPAAGSEIPVGARVVIDPSLSCGACDVCERDLPHLCPRGGLMGRDRDGGFAELIAVPPARLHVLPDGISDADAVGVQMLSTVVHGQALLSPQLGQSALVVGLGATGLLHVRLLAARGVSPVIGVSRSAAKRALASQLGATVTATPDEALKAVATATAGRGVEIAVECVGQRDALVQTMTAAGPGSTVLIFGTIAPSADGMPTYDWYLKELTLKATRAARPRDFTAAVRAIRDGLVNPSTLITSTYALADAAAALDAAARPEQIKVTIAIGGAPADPTPVSRAR